MAVTSVGSHMPVAAPCTTSDRGGDYLELGPIALTKAEG